MKPQTHTVARLSWYTAYAAGIAVIWVFWWQATGHTTTATTESIYMAIGNITGLLGAYLILWQVVLLSRLPVLEHHIGMEKLTWLHKWNGYTALILILIHSVFLTIGFAFINHMGIISQLFDFIWHWEDMLKATVATVLLIVIVLISIGIVRRRLRYETWYYVHIFSYLVILFAFSHQLSVGSDFLGQRTFTAFWYVIYALAAGLIGYYRFLVPTLWVYRYQFRVDHLVQETPDVLSVYITGRNLDRIKYLPGQFMIWRFLSKDLWWQAHPFSISVAPGAGYLRLTAKQLGDFTRSLSNLKPGTWVSIDGPHGNFTTERLSNPKVLMIAGGVGITPIRSMLEAMPAGVQSVVLVYAARTQADLALRPELEAIVARYHGTIKYLLSNETTPGLATGVLDDANLRLLVPDAPSREVMLCGPPPMMNAVTKTLEGQGIASKHIHTERFAY